MAKPLKELGLRDVEALRRRTIRDYMEKRISKESSNRIHALLTDLEREILEPKTSIKKES